MTTQIFFSSNKLGMVTDEQLQVMLNRFNLGKLVSAAKTAKGVGNQTLFVRSSVGEFVLKGNPLFAGQFDEEKFYIDQLLERTALPLPSPYLVDEATDIFGWTYAVMPRLPGRHLNDPEFSVGLGSDDKLQIAELLATTLGQCHSWKVDRCGEFHPTQRAIRPFRGSYKAWLYGRIRYWLDDAKKYSTILHSDLEWAEGLLTAAEEAFDNLGSPSYVMGDFKADNILLQGGNHRWRLSGIFDFTNGYFGDGLADLPKIVIMYLNARETELAQRFIMAYFNGSPAKAGFRDRLKVHLLHQLVLDWGCAKATHTVTWDDHLPFSRWAQGYTELPTHWLS